MCLPKRTKKIGPTWFSLFGIAQEEKRKLDYVVSVACAGSFAKADSVLIFKN